MRPLSLALLVSSVVLPALAWPDPSHLPPPSSCFSAALSSLPSSSSSSSSSSASSCDALSQSDAARTALAARMALCEIRTSLEGGGGGGKVPRECEEWEKGKRGGRVGSCVDGYLREIVTLCSAFRRWADVSLASSLNARTALTFSSFLAELRFYEQARAEKEQEEGEAMKSVREDVEKLLGRLKGVERVVSVERAKAKGEMSVMVDALAGLSEVMGIQLSVLERGMEGVLQKVREEMGGMAEGVRMGLRGAVEEHKTSLLTVSGLVENGLVSSLKQFEARQAALADGLNDLVSTIRTADSSLRAVNSVLLDLEPFSTSLAASLSGSSSAASLLEGQLSTVSRFHLDQAEHLTAVLSNLTALAEQQQQHFTGWRRATGGGYELGWEELGWTVVQAVWGRTTFGGQALNTVAMVLVAYLCYAVGLSNTPIFTILFFLALRFLPLFRSFSIRKPRLDSVRPVLRLLRAFPPSKSRSSPSPFASPSFSPVKPPRAVRFASPLSSSRLSLASTAFDRRAGSMGVGEEVEETVRRFVRAQSAPL
ncbi:hypothetical protein JCM8547_002538 [Rhodosporidiobolus lusitaniae]